MQVNMIKILFLSFSILSSVVLAKTITLSADATLPPFDYLNEYGEVTGFSSDVLKAAAAEVNMNVMVYNQPWAEIFNTIENGSRDAVSNVYISEQRKQQYFITEPYFAIEFIGVTQSNNPNESLKNMTFAVLENSLANTVVDAIIKAFPSSKKLVTKSDFLSFKAIFTGKADIAIGQDIVFENFIKRYPERQTKMIAFYPQFPEAKTETGFALMKHNAILGKKINQGLTTIKNNGVYDQLITKYFSKNN